jgi:hypothetical protein
MKEYVIEGSLKDWMVDNAEEIFVNVLESCERGPGNESIEIMRLITITGITSFKIGNRDAAINSLNKCEKYFVKIEDYEKAARCRDCSKLWQAL